MFRVTKNSSKELRQHVVDLVIELDEFHEQYDPPNGSYPTLNREVDTYFKEHTKRDFVFVFFQEKNTHRIHPVDWS